jgi:hypothetical protein
VNPRDQNQFHIRLPLVESLNHEDKQRLIDYLQKSDETPKRSSFPLGLHAHLGEMWMSDDFCAELPDSFWFGKT